MNQSGIFKIQSMADPAWFNDGKNDCLYIEIYEMALAPSSFEGKVFKFNNITVIAGVIGMDYLEIGTINVDFGENRQVSVSADHRTVTGKLSPKVITLQPHSRSRIDSERELADHSSEYVSLLVATNYRNIAFRLISRNFFGYSDNYLHANSFAFRLPFDLPHPDLSTLAWQRFFDAEMTFASASKDLKRKISLSLQWHLKAVRSDGIDSLLSFWIAIETLSMKSTNIAEIIEKLAKIYNTSKESASAEFGIGKIFGLRSAIVHKGHRKVISSHLTDYLEHLYSDLLMFELRLPTMMRAKSYLAGVKIDIDALTA